MKHLKIVRSIAFIIIAIVAFIFSSKIDDMNDGGYVSSSVYGGDAYTGIQNASAETGCNVYKGNQIIQKGFKYTFILIGLGFLVVGLTPTLQPKNGEENNIKENTTIEA
jgi:hypothetical protein